MNFEKFKIVEFYKVPSMVLTQFISTNLEHHKYYLNWSSDFQTIHLNLFPFYSISMCWLNYTHSIEDRSFLAPFYYVSQLFYYSGLFCSNLPFFNLTLLTILGMFSLD